MSSGNFRHTWNMFISVKNLIFLNLSLEIRKEQFNDIV